MRSKDADQVLTKMTRMFPWILKNKSMLFGCSKTVSKILKGFLIAFGKIKSLSRLSEVLYFQNHHYHYHHYNFCVVVVVVVVIITTIYMNLPI